MWPKLPLLVCLALNVSAQRVVSNPTNEHWTAELNGTWLWQAGDNLAWAAPSFDDSKWPQLAIPGPPPAQARYWIRIPVRLISAHDPGLLLGPISYAYEVYCDGKQIGHFGKLPPDGEWFIPRWNVFKIPSTLAVPGNHIIAIRLWNARGGWSTRDPRYAATDNRVGNHDALSEAEASLMSADFHVRLVELLLTFGIVLAGLYFFLLPPSISQGAAFRWFGAALVFKGLHVVSAFYANDGPFNVSAVALRAIGHMGIILFFLMFIDFAYALFNRRVPFPVRSFQGLMIVFLLMRIILEHSTPIPFFTAVVFWIELIASLIPVVLAAIRLRAGFPGSGISVALFSVVALIALLNLLTHDYGLSKGTTFGPGFFTVGSFQVNAVNAALVLWIPAMAMQIHKANLRFRDEGERLRGEMEAARHVQELLVPTSLIHAPGFTIETSYIPATEVGGDFFQLLPTVNNGVLVVVGDVSGKGMRAALLVSVIVGALRNRKSDDPAALLTELNAVLMGGSHGGFTTCCCALLTHDGTATLASAGHLAPYRNGQEVPTPPGLPLGLTAGMQWEETCIILEPDDRLLWISDGVVEARNGKRDLLGFERAQKLTSRPASEIALAAQQFGQEDDITVVSIMRQPVPVYVA